MKRILVLIMIVFVLSNISSIGIGIMAGSPSGLSLKFGRMHFAVGFSTFKGENYALHFTYEIPFKIDFSNGNVIPMYIGLGIYGQDTGDFGLGVRFPIGIQFWLASNLVFFGEVTAAYSFMPETKFHVFGGLGLRLHFKITK
ncbi:hypothetical protein KAI78_08580 [bacterium]|nr:hypothetical protein [bacterium]